jgi:hypothetical protein
MPSTDRKLELKANIDGSDRPTAVWVRYAKGLNLHNGGYCSPDLNLIEIHQVV